MPFTSTTCWTNTTAVQGYLILKGKIQTQDPISIQSCTQLDTIMFDTDTYRNELSAAYIGRPWMNLVKNTGAVNSVLLFGPQGIEPAAGQVNDVTIADTDTQSQIADDVTTKDDVYQGTEPFSTPKKLSLYLFWSGANGTGNVVAMCKVEDFTSFEIEKSQSIF